MLWKQKTIKMLKLWKLRNGTCYPLSICLSEMFNPTSSFPWREKSVHQARECDKQCTPYLYPQKFSKYGHVWGRKAESHIRRSKRSCESWSAFTVCITLYCLLCVVHWASDQISMERPFDLNFSSTFPLCLYFFTFSDPVLPLKKFWHGLPF